MTKTTGLLIIACMINQQYLTSYLSDRPKNSGSFKNTLHNRRPRKFELFDDASYF